MNEAERARFHSDFARALEFATRLHAGQLRKGTDIPYISHLIGVAGIVLEYLLSPVRRVTGEAGRER